MRGYPDADQVPFLVRRGLDINHVKKGDFGIVIHNGVAVAFMDSNNQTTDQVDFDEASTAVHRALGYAPWAPRGKQKKCPVGGNSLHGRTTIIAFPNSGGSNLPPGFIYTASQITSRVRDILKNPNRTKGLGPIPPI